MRRRIKPFSLASLASNDFRVAAAAVWSMSKIAVTRDAAVDSLCMDDIPQNRFLPLTKIHSVCRGMTMQGTDFHAVDDWLGAANVATYRPDVRACRWLCAAGRTVGILGA